MLEAIRRARFSIISSVRRHTVAGLIVKDLFRGFEFWLVDEGLESSLRIAVILCLLLGWSGIIAYDSLATLPNSSLWLLAIGGILYTLGTLFHVLRRLRFHNAIWHGFVLVAASCHYSPVLACLPLA